MTIFLYVLGAASVFAVVVTVSACMLSSRREKALFPDMAAVSVPADEAPTRGSMIGAQEEPQHA